jgi:hypothetical protein
MRQDRLLGEPAHAGEISFQDSMHRLQGMPDDGGDLLHRATRFGEACNRRATEVVENPSHSIKQSDGDAFASNPLCNLSSSVGFQTRNRRLRFWVGDKKFDGPFSISELNEPTERVRRSVPKLSWGSSSRLTPAAIRPNERSESAFRAAANAVFAAAVTPGASPRASGLPSADRRLRYR